ncbi:MAG: Rieske (2Fe-2S) protein [Dehalococcoidia bacterium]|nr:Rieske (2Fe-2S) protein [Dehalococcoidia bacterium]
MADFIEVANANELASSAMKEVAVGGQNVLLARIGDSYYATQGRCPHMGGIFASGKLEGTVVTCPRHGSQFDVTSGKFIRWTHYTGLTLGMIKLLKSPRGLSTYEVKIEKGKIFVKI